MPSGELFLFRPYRVLSALYERILLKLNLLSAAHSTIEPQDTDFSTFFINLKERDMIEADLAGTLDATLERTEKIMQHQYFFFGHDEEEGTARPLIMGNTIDWHKDYASDMRFDLKFGKDINYRDATKYGDVKYVWELNRHIHLVPTAKAFYLTGDQRYRDEVLEQIMDWISSNPYLIGINWTSALEVALRLINWCWVWFLLDARTPIEHDYARTFLSSIYRHCHFIRHNYSAYSSANNHLVGEAAGLFIASSLFSFFPDAQHWNEWSRKILEREIRLQISPDGVNKEQAIDYHCFSLELFVLAYLTGKKANRVFSEEYERRLHAMMHFLASVISHETGVVPQIGDSDNARVLELDSSRYNRYLSLLNTGAAIFKDSTLKVHDGELDEQSYWLLGGREAKETFSSISRQEHLSDDRLISFDSGGYHIFDVKNEQGIRGKLIFDCAPLGYLSIAAHGHADALACILSVNGEEILTDPGTYAYHTNRRWRDYFRSTRAHNTITVNGRDQSVMGGAFLWTEKANARTVDSHCNSSTLFVKGVHDGYVRLKPPVEHIRSITWDKTKQIFVIVDKLESPSPVDITLHFHLVPAGEAESGNGNVVIIKRRGIYVVLRLPHEMDVSLHKGEEDPRILGWYSRHLGIKAPTWTIAAAGKFNPDTELRTLISFANNPEDALHRVFS